MHEAILGQNGLLVAVLLCIFLLLRRLVLLQGKTRRVSNLGLYLWLGAADGTKEKRGWILCEPCRLEANRS